MSKLEQHVILSDATPDDRSIIRTVISELGTNILKYAHGGAIRVYRAKQKENVFIDIWAEDQGPGILDIELAMTDYFSTGNSLGLGLPGVKRMVDEFWIRSNPEQGTLVQIRKRLKTTRKDPFNHVPALEPSLMVQFPKIAQRRTEHWDCSDLIHPKYGEINSGDFIIVKSNDDYLFALMIDVTGHGDSAHRVGNDLIQQLGDSYDRDLSKLVQKIHHLLQGTVGAAIGILLIDRKNQGFEYTGVGNTMLKKYGITEWTGISKDGIMGQRMPTLFIERQKLQAGDVLVLTSDGMHTHALPESLRANHDLSANELIQRVMRPNIKSDDDASCLVVKWL
jgi:anti-sigma regulatory factor (Ser/Thr protein kinase)